MTTPRPNTPQTFRQRTQQDDIDLMEYFYMFLGNWYWFALAVIVGIGTAYFINKYSTRVYQVKATMLIEDESSNPYGMGSSMFGGSDIMSGFGLYPSYYNFQNQILIMKSQSLVSKTIHSLDFGVSYFSDELFGIREKLTDVPFVVIPDYGKLQALGVNFIVDFDSDGKIKIRNETADDKITLYNFLTERSLGNLGKIDLDREVIFGEILDGEGYSFTLLPRGEGNNNGKVKPGTWLFSFKSYSNQIGTWSSSLILKSIDKDASMVSLEVSTACPVKAQIFLDKHIEMYLQRTLDKKNQVATNTINFIDRQLISIGDSLDITEINLQDYRRNNQVVDLSFQSQQLFEQTKLLDNQKATMKMQDEYFRYLIDYLERNRDAGDLVAPSVMGIDDPLLNNLVLELNRMADQKIAMVGTGASENPYLGTLESQIRSAKARLEENTRNLLNNNSLAMRDVNARFDVLMAEVRRLPQTERELLGIERKFKLNDNIYTYLLQRRAEAQIAKASNTPDNEIIDPAMIIETIRPKPMKNFAVGLVLGFLVPGMILVLISAFNNKITSEDDIKHITELPVAGHITHSLRDYQTVVLNDPKSQVSETFRSLRTRLQFFTKDTPSPVILITSSMPADGKTFASINLASAYSLAGKRTVLVGFDLRKPKIYTDFGLNDIKGLSTYLIGRDSLNDIIQASEYENLSVISAGPIPPNPSELASSVKTREFFAELKRLFDYIIVDSAPLGAVSDTFSLASISDITIILVRHNKTIKHILHNTITDAKANGITGMSLLLNDISRDRGIYGYYGKYRYVYGYGYGYSYSNSNGNGKTKR